MNKAMHDYQWWVCLSWEKDYRLLINNKLYLTQKYRHTKLQCIEQILMHVHCTASTVCLNKLGFYRKYKQISTHSQQFAVKQSLNKINKIFSILVNVHRQNMKK